MVPKAVMALVVAALASGPGVECDPLSHMAAHGKQRKRKHSGGERTGGKSKKPPAPWMTACHNSTSTGACPVSAIERHFEEHATMPIRYGSIDIIRHLPVLRRLASTVTSASELGVRYGIASWAIAAGAMDRLRAGGKFERYTAVDITRWVFLNTKRFSAAAAAAINERA